MPRALESNHQSRPLGDTAVKAAITGRQDVSRELKAGAHIVVIDARPHDYCDLPRLSAERGLHVHFLTTGNAAVQFMPRTFAALWMINMQLPDIPGLDVVELLRERRVEGSICSVADKYDAHEEQAACCRGADLYVCKDANHSLELSDIFAALAPRKDFNVLDGPPHLPEAAVTPGLIRPQRIGAVARSPDG